MPEIETLTQMMLSNTGVGQSWVYHRGFLAFDRAISYELDVKARLIWEAYQTERFVLYQLKAGHSDYFYFVKRVKYE